MSSQIAATHRLQACGSTGCGVTGSLWQCQGHQSILKTTSSPGSHNSYQMRENHSDNRSTPILSLPALLTSLLPFTPLLPLPISLELTSCLLALLHTPHALLRSAILAPELLLKAVIKDFGTADCRGSGGVAFIARLAQKTHLLGLYDALEQAWLGALQGDRAFTSPRTCVDESSQQPSRDEEVSLLTTSRIVRVETALAPIRSEYLHRLHYEQYTRVPVVECKEEKSRRPVVWIGDVPPRLVTPAELEAQIGLPPLKSRKREEIGSATEGYQRLGTTTACLVVKEVVKEAVAAIRAISDTETLAG